MKSSPACDRGPFAHIRFIGVGQANRNDVSLEADGLVQPQQCQIILESSGIELRVWCNDLDTPLQMGVRFLVSAYVKLTKTKQKIGRRNTKNYESFVSSILKLWYAYFSTQCAAVTTQYSFKSAAPHLCKNAFFFHCLNETIQGHSPYAD